jgi:hypothetical protein
MLRSRAKRLRRAGETVAGAVARSRDDWLKRRYLKCSYFQGLRIDAPVVARLSRSM